MSLLISQRAVDERLGPHHLTRGARREEAGAADAFGLSRVRGRLEAFEQGLARPVVFTLLTEEQAELAVAVPGVGPGRTGLDPLRPYEASLINLP